METDNKGCGAGGGQQYPSGPWIPDLLDTIQPTGGEPATLVQQHGSLEPCRPKDNNATTTSAGTRAAGFIGKPPKGPNASGLFDILQRFT